jgi:hypothetical protein
METTGCTFLPPFSTGGATSFPWGNTVYPVVEWPQPRSTTHELCLTESFDIRKPSYPIGLQYIETLGNPRFQRLRIRTLVENMHSPHSTPRPLFRYKSFCRRGGGGETKETDINSDPVKFYCAE